MSLVVWISVIFLARGVDPSLADAPFFFLREGFIDPFGSLELDFLLADSLFEFF